MVATTGEVVLFTAAKGTRFPVPLVAKPIDCAVLVQL